MKKTNGNICDRHILGSETSVCAVRAGTDDARDWLLTAPVCDSLNEYRITHCGIMNAMPPFGITRVKLSGTFFFACLQGQGGVLINGEWRIVGPGQACIQPPFIPNALKATEREPWVFCWVRYRPAGTQPLVSLHSPSIGDFAGAALKSGIEGLHSEASQATSQHALRKWVELIHVYVLAFSQPFVGNEELLQLWSTVEHRLDEKWTLERLSNAACVSKEQLRRLCLSSLGHAPIQHVAFLRMQHAAQLLVTTDKPIATVARLVGYANQFAFSDTFQRWLGCRPSTYRKQRS